MEARLHCSFCQRPDTQVRRLVAGGGGGYICDECVSVAARIIADSDSPVERHGPWHRIRAAFRHLGGGRRGQTGLCASVPRV